MAFCVVCFRPLTGIVHGDDWYFLADAGFRPLTGIVPYNISQNTAKLKSRMARK